MVATSLAYVPGLNGDFLFDDIPNLSPLGEYGSILDKDSFRSFILSGFSGPTGRPLSLASFLLDDNTWPSHAPWFKQTNLLIHLLCGLFLCWAVLLLLRNLDGIAEEHVQWIAVLSCAVWLLHPYMVSTTLYVVQRMAQLAALFTLMGVVLYLRARLWLHLYPARSYVLMAFAIVGGTILAVLCKENGALLPLLILVIEFCLPKNGKPDWRWRALFLWLPSFAIAILLARYVNFSDNPWPNRSFNQLERLLTESRIVTEYLFHLLVPRIEGNGLYQDGYIISKGMLAPVSTLFSILFLSLLVCLSFVVRKKSPLITLAILFFLTAHLMESTVVGLELYFEHRNYLASLFLFLPFAYYCVILSGRYKMLPVIAMTILGILASMTWLRTSLWADNDRLELHWIQSATESPRAANSMATFLIKNGQHESAYQYLEAENLRLNDSSLLTMRVLLEKIKVGAAAQQDFLYSGERLKNQKFDAQTIQGLRALVDMIVAGERQEYARYSFSLLDSMQDSLIYNRVPLFVRLQFYLRGQLYLYLKDPEQACANFSQAMDHYQETDAALAMVALVASAGYPSNALILLKQANTVFERQSDLKLKRSRHSYERDFEYLENELLDAEKQENRE